MLIHTVHALAVFVWTGGLLVIGFSSKTDRNWEIIFEWFRPLVALCFLIIVGSGIYLMSVVVSVEEYADSWILPYGQTLLWKHVLILLVLIIGFMNRSGVMRIPNNHSKSSRCECAWEGVFILLIFIATALLGQQEPPHSIKDTLKTSRAGILSEIIFPSLGFAYSDIQFEPTAISIILVTISLLFGGPLVFVIRTTHGSIKTFYLGLGVSVSLFFVALYSISVFL